MTEIILSTNVDIKVRRMLLKSKEDIAKKNERIIAEKEKLIAEKDKRITETKAVHTLLMNELNLKYEKAVFARAHLESMLSVRFLIETFEQRFCKKIRNLNVSRIDKWKAYFSESSDRFAPFAAATSLSETAVSDEIHSLFNSKSACIHSSHILGNDAFAIHVRKGLSATQLDLVNVMIKISGWDVTVT
ncbi:hypothetical protein HK100_000409 [Physocladia obscura]|uniref:Uncharacterized protein n=1 Tax=Physocladia obscura TaxID=109957 RepID=A0AAD5SYI1_9FUNG|nr:hypothetical protein HK100_000409 [Physocladia obscura]